MEQFIPIFFFLCTAFVLLAMIYTRHKERVLLIEKGLSGDFVQALYARRQYRFQFLPLLWGCVFTSIGLALLLGLPLEQWNLMPDGISVALCILGIGIAILIFYFLATKKKDLMNGIIKNS